MLEKKEEQKKAISESKKALNNKYMEYVRWFALPVNAKIDETGCKNEVQFALKYGVARSTIWKWKNSEDFMERIKQMRFTWGKESTPNVFAGWLNSCMKGNPYSIELWLAYFEQWDKKNVIENRVPEFTNDDLLTLIKILPKDKQQKFYDTVNQIIITAREERENASLDGVKDYGDGQKNKATPKSDKTDSNIGAKSNQMDGQDSIQLKRIE